MIQDMQLNFFVENAAKVEAANPGKGVAWASNQLAPPVSFAANSSAICDGVPAAQITGQWPVFQAISPTLSTQAMLAKIIPSGMPDGILVGSMVSLRPYLVGFRFKCNRSTFQRESL